MSMNIKTCAEYGIGGGGSAKSAPMCAADRLSNAMDEVEKASSELESRIRTIYGRLTGKSIPNHAVDSDLKERSDREGSVFGRAMDATSQTMQRLNRAMATVATIEEEIGL